NADNLAFTDAYVAHGIEIGFRVHDATALEHEVVLLGEKDGCGEYEKAERKNQVAHGGSVGGWLVRCYQLQIAQQHHSRLIRLRGAAARNVPTLGERDVASSVSTTRGRSGRTRPDASMLIHVH